MRRHSLTGSVIGGLLAVTLMRLLGPCDLAVGGTYLGSAQREPGRLIDAGDFLRAERIA